MQLTHTLFHH